MNANTAKKIRVLFVSTCGFTLFGDAQVFLGLGEIRMETQRLLELRDRLSGLAFAHENLTQVVVWLSKFRVEVVSPLKLVLGFAKISLLKNCTSVSTMSI